MLLCWWWCFFVVTSVIVVVVAAAVVMEIGERQKASKHQRFRLSVVYDTDEASSKVYSVASKSCAATAATGAEDEDADTAFAVVDEQQELLA